MLVNNRCSINSKTLIKFLPIILALCIQLPLFAQSKVLTYDSSFHNSYYDQKVSLFRLLPVTEGSIIFVGNSITDIGEWSEMWQNIKVKNRGISSDITFGVLDRLDEIIRSKPSKAFLMIGINDIARGIPDKTIIRNISRILEQLQEESPEITVFVQSILPTNSAFTEYINHQNKGQHIKTINSALEELVPQYGAVYVDLHAIFVDEKGNLDKQYTNDGLHLNGAGYLHWKAFLENKNFCCD